jgi:hypothetical protein
MSDDFAAKADDTPWTASQPIVNLDDVNPPNATDAKASLRLDLDDADRADTAAFNRILIDYAKKQRSSEGADASRPTLR